MTRAGTGKTFASAFAMREENPKKVLFFVHREQIAKQAMEENLLCPFHYFGITDLVIDGETSQDDSANEKKDQVARLRQFNFLTSDARVDYIMEKAAYYGHSGDRVKGLMFVSRREVGEELSRKFNEKGLRTVFLSGETSQEKREAYIKRLVSDDPDAERLDYILTVDIFNEGVDIPDINQVIMLRPTQSPIIFVQQLGRGLRKANDKEFVVLLDFIGNYTKDESVVATQQYEDQFTAPDRLTAISKPGRTFASDDVQNFLYCEKRGIAVHLFVRKNKEDKVSKEFYYLGRMFPDIDAKPEEFILSGTNKTAVRLYWKLDVPVREDLYEYITEEEL